jgi:hypothetical protein
MFNDEFLGLMLFGSWAVGARENGDVNTLAPFNSLM